jgi:hypothetical protein
MQRQPHPTLRFAAAWFLALIAVAGLAESSILGIRRVRIVYLVSSDRSEDLEYTDAINHAIRDLQGWYSRQLGGPTFRLGDPVVEVVKSFRPAEWFYGHTNGANPDDWGFNNTLDEARRLLGAKPSDPAFVWVVYSDGPGNKGRALPGVACLPEDDLLGLVGRTRPNRTRPVGLPGWAMSSATLSDCRTRPTPKRTPTQSCGRGFTANTPITPT